MTENNEPEFEVQRIETRHDTLIALVPKFTASDLSDEQRAVYDALRDAGAGHHSGAITVNEIAESKFKEGETVTLGEVLERYEQAIDEVKETFEQLAESIDTALGKLTPIMGDLAQSIATNGERDR